MVRTQISLDRALYKRARLVAKRHGVSFAELCRRGIVEVLARERSDMPWMRHMGAFEGSPGDSERVDEIVYGRETP
jgi:hypothetical protein